MTQALAHLRWRLPLDIVAALLALCAGLLVLHLANPAITSALSMEGVFATISSKETISPQMHIVLNGPRDNRGRALQEGTALVTLEYHKGQNTQLLVEVHYACITSMSIKPEDPPLTQKIALRICNNSVMDLAPYLLEGKNQLRFELTAYQSNIALYLNPKLFGEHFLSTVGVLMLFAALFFLAWRAVQASGLDWRSCLLLMGGLLYCSTWLLWRPNLAYTNDLSGHIDYLEHMLANWQNPYAYTGRENWHPPLYYFVVSRFVWPFYELGGISILSAARGFSLVLYTLFCVFGMKALRLVIGQHNLTYYVGCALLIFWPVNIIMATRINNDVALYACWSACFYYLLHWHMTRQLRSLYVAMLLLVPALLIKSNGYVLCGVVGFGMLWGLYSQRLSWRGLFHWRMLLVGCVVLLGAVGNTGRLIYMKLNGIKQQADMHFGGAHNHEAGFSHFFSFDFANFIHKPFISNSWDMRVFETWEKTYLNFFLKSALYGEFNWHSGALIQFASIANLLLVALLLLTIGGLFMGLLYKALRLDELVLSLAGLLLPLLASVLFMIIKQWDVAQDFRFVLPMMIAFILLYARSMEGLRQSRFLRPYYYVGMAAGCGLPLLGAMVYMSWAFSQVRW